MCTPVPRVTTKKTIHKIKTINKSRWNLKKCSSDPHRKAKKERNKSMWTRETYKTNNRVAYLNLNISIIPL